MKYIYLLITVSLLISCNKKATRQADSFIGTSVEQAVIIEEDSMDYDDENFRIKMPDKDKYVLNRHDTILLKKPFLKMFSGLVNGQPAQVWMRYYLPSMEGLVTEYDLCGHMYVQGNEYVNYFSLAVNDPNCSILEIDNQDNETGKVLYYLTYLPEKNKVKIKENGNEYVLSESSEKYQVYDAFTYANVYCYEHHIMRSHWSYMYSFLPLDPTNVYLKSLSVKEIDEMKTRKHDISLEMKKNSNREIEEEENYCFTLYDHIVKYPFYSDSLIFTMVLSADIYMGGAHGIYNMCYSNFDKKTGKEISLEDLFDVENEDFTELLSEKIREKFDADFELPTQFYILPTGIGLRFPPYSLNGGFWEKEIMLTTSEAAPYLKRHYY